MILYCIDPAATWPRLGWAIFANGVLSNAGIGEPPLFRAETLIVEIPQAYPGDYEHDANDLIRVALLAGRAVERLQPVRVVEVKPRQWKGTVPKPIHNRRTIAALTADERTRVPNDHNAIDAVGLGLWQLKRSR